MNRVDESLKALESHDWSTAEVDSRRRNVSVVQSVRMPKALVKQVAVEAERRGMTPSQLIRELVATGLEASNSSETVRLIDVHRAIDGLRRSA